MIAVRMAPPAPPATTWEMMLPMLKLPDSAAAITEGSARVTIWPSTPPPTRPETMFPTVPRSKLGDALRRSLSGCPIAAVYLPSLRQARRRRAAGFQLEQDAGRGDGLSSLDRPPGA